MASKKHSTVFSILVIGTAAVLFWRGAWGLLDLYFFPNDPLISYGVSLVVGFVILFATKRLAEELL